MVSSDALGALVLPHNTVDLHSSLKRSNLTLEACTNARGAAGSFQCLVLEGTQLLTKGLPVLADAEFADEYCMSCSHS